jgi:magnesium transporter
MGLALGGTLGLIAFARGAATPDDTRSGPRKVKEPFSIRVDPGTELRPDEAGDIPLAAGTTQTTVTEKKAKVRLPEGAKELPPPDVHPDGWVYRFPGGCEVRTQPVSRASLGVVIALAVLGICLWGTLMGCLIPLGLQKLGQDPAIASGPTVATVVDVTGIAIFFLAARLILL